MGKLFGDFFKSGGSIEEKIGLVSEGHARGSVSAPQESGKDIPNEKNTDYRWLADDLSLDSIDDNGSNKKTRPPRVWTSVGSRKPSPIDGSLIDPNREPRIVRGRPVPAAKNIDGTVDLSSGAIQNQYLDHKVVYQLVNR